MDYDQLKISHCCHYLSKLIVSLSICAAYINGIQYSAAIKSPASSVGYYHGRGNPPGDWFSTSFKSNGTFNLLKLNSSRQSHVHQLNKLNDQNNVINKADDNDSKWQNDHTSVYLKKDTSDQTDEHELGNNTKNEQTSIKYLKQNNNIIELPEDKRTKRCSSKTNTLSLRQKPLNLQKAKVLTNPNNKMACCEIINKLIAEAFKVQNNCKCASDVDLNSKNSKSGLIENANELETNEIKDNRNNPDIKYPNNDNLLVVTEMNTPQETKLHTKRNNYVEPTENGLIVNNNDEYRVNSIRDKQGGDFHSTNDANRVGASESMNVLMPLYQVKQKTKELSEESTIKAIINDNVTLIYTEKQTEFETETEQNELTSDITKKLQSEPSKTTEEHETNLQNMMDGLHESETIKYPQDNISKANSIYLERSDLIENQNKDINLASKENLSANLSYNDELMFINNKSHGEDIYNNNTKNANKKLLNITDKTDLKTNSADNDTSQESRDQTDDMNVAWYQTTSTPDTTDIVGDIQQACRNYYARNNEINQSSQTLSPFNVLLCTNTSLFNDYIGKEFLTIKPMESSNDGNKDDVITDKDTYQTLKQDIYHDESDYEYNLSENGANNNLASINNKESQNAFKEQQIYNSLLTKDEVNKNVLINRTDTLTDGTFHSQLTPDIHTILGMVTEVPSQLDFQNVFTEVPNEFNRKQSNDVDTNITLLFFTNSEDKSGSNIYNKDFSTVFDQDNRKNESDSEHNIGFVNELEDFMTHDTSTTSNPAKNLTVSYDNVNKNIETAAYDDSKEVMKRLSTTWPNHIGVELLKSDINKTNYNEDIDLNYRLQNIGITTIEPQEKTSNMNGIILHNSNVTTKDDNGNENFIYNSNEVTAVQRQSNGNLNNMSVIQETYLHDPVNNLQNVPEIDKNMFERNGLQQQETNLSQAVTESYRIITIENDIIETEELDANFTDNSAVQEIHIANLKSEEENIDENDATSNYNMFEASKSSTVDTTRSQNYQNVNTDDNTYDNVNMNPLQEVMQMTTTDDNNYIIHNNNQANYITITPLEPGRFASEIEIPKTDVNNIVGRENYNSNHEHIHKTNNVTFEPQVNNTALQEDDLNVTSLDDVKTISETNTTTDTLKQLDPYHVQPLPSDRKNLSIVMESEYNNKSVINIPETNNIKPSPLNQLYENSNALQAINFNDTIIEPSNISNALVNIEETSLGKQLDVESTSEPLIKNIQVILKQNNETNLKYDEESNKVTVFPQITSSISMIAKQYNNVIDGQYVTDSSDNNVNARQQQHTNDDRSILPDENSNKDHTYVNDSGNTLTGTDLVQNVNYKSERNEENTDRIDLLPSIINASDKNKEYKENDNQETNKPNDITSVVPLQSQQNEDEKIDRLSIPELIPLGIVSDLTATSETENAIPAILHLPVLLKLTNLTLIDSPDSKFYVENNGSKLELYLLKSETPKTSINSYYKLMDTLKKNSFNEDTASFNNQSTRSVELVNKIIKRMNNNFANHDWNKTLPTIFHEKSVNNSNFPTKDDLSMNYNNANVLNTSTDAMYRKENQPPENQKFFRHSRYKELTITPKENNSNNLKRINLSSNSYSDKLFDQNHSILTKSLYEDSYNDFSKHNDDNTKMELESYTTHNNNIYHENSDNHLNSGMYKPNDHTKGTHTFELYDRFKNIDKDIYEKFLNIYKTKRYRNDRRENIPLPDEHKVSQQSKRSLGVDISDKINRIIDDKGSQKFTKDQSIIDVLYTSFKRIKKVFTE